MPSYPSTLPAPLAANYGIAPVDQTARTDMEVGAARVRRRTRARNDVLDVAFLFTDAQFSAFRTWFENDATGISGGSSWFDMDIPVGNGGVTSEEVRFKGSWKSGRDGQHWRITAQLEVR